MNTAVIAEYNPFHNGHLFHLEMTRSITGCDNVIAVMSGNFVQRGEPAVLEKHIRTRHALMNGADMVLELPVEFAAGAADVFSGAAVHLIEKSGIVDALCFGSEEGSLDRISKAAEVFAFESEGFKNALGEFLSLGLSYPLARMKAAETIIGENGDLLTSPNNILAVEYLTALKKIGSKIKPYTVKRSSNDYNDKELSGKLSSAAAIRQKLKKGSVPFEALPENTVSAYENFVYPKTERYDPIISYILRTADDLSDIADMTEGLENRFKKYAEKKTADELIKAVKTKRYTVTKLKRAVLHMLLGIDKKMQNEMPRYIRVLGVRQDKKFLLNDLAAKSSLPVIIRVKENETLLGTEIKTTDIYHIATDNMIGCEFKNGIVMV